MSVAAQAAAARADGSAAEPASGNAAFAETAAIVITASARNLDTLWTTTATWEAVTLVILQDCINRRGQYEEAT